MSSSLLHKFFTVWAGVVLEHLEQIQSSSISADPGGSTSPGHSGSEQRMALINEPNSEGSMHLAQVHSKNQHSLSSSNWSYETRLMTKFTWCPSFCASDQTWRRCIGWLSLHLGTERSVPQPWHHVTTFTFAYSLLGPQLDIEIWHDTKRNCHIHS